MDIDTYLMIGVLVTIFVIPILCIIVGVIRACVCRENNTNQINQEIKLETINEEYTEISVN
jgi:ethanolamine transporter EutH